MYHIQQIMYVSYAADYICEMTHIQYSAYNVHQINLCYDMYYPYCVMINIQQIMHVSCSANYLCVKFSQLLILTGWEDWDNTDTKVYTYHYLNV